MKYKTFLAVLALGILAFGLALQAGAPKNGDGELQERR